MPGAGLAERVEEELAALAADVTASAFDISPDARAIRSVHRTGAPS